LEVQGGDNMKKNGFLTYVYVKTEEGAQMPVGLFKDSTLAHQAMREIDKVLFENPGWLVETEFIYLDVIEEWDLESWMKEAEL